MLLALTFARTDSVQHVGCGTACWVTVTFTMPYINSDKWRKRYNNVLSYYEGRVTHLTRFEDFIYYKTRIRLCFVLQQFSGTKAVILSLHLKLSDKRNLLSIYDSFDIKSSWGCLLKKMRHLGLHEKQKNDKNLVFGSTWIVHRWWNFGIFI